VNDLMMDYHPVLLPGEKNGARSRDRTNDLLITNQLLCQLSYAGNGMAILSDQSQELKL
jgi:hypothetical protein